MIVTSAATGQGLDELSRELMPHVPEHRSSRRPPTTSRRRAPGLPARPTTQGYSVERGPRRSAPRGRAGVERLLARHDIENEEALRYVEERLRKMGVIRALEPAGFKAGDDVELAGTVFELDPGAPFR